MLFQQQACLVVLTLVNDITCLFPQGGVSVDCITDLDDNQSQLLEALQLSLPAEAAGSRRKRRDKKLSLNPIYRQVPRVVDLCCQHLERHGACGESPALLQKVPSISLLKGDHSLSLL